MFSRLEEFKSWLCADVAHISLDRDLEANGSEGYLEQRVPSKTTGIDPSVSIGFFRVVPKESLLEARPDRDVDCRASQGVYKYSPEETFSCSIS